MNKRKAQMRWQNPAFIESILAELKTIFEIGQFNGPFDMRGAIIGLEGACHYLFDKGFTRANLTIIDFRFSKISTNFTNGSFRQIDFTNAYFDRAFMSKTTWHDCSFDSANICIHADDAIFSGCTFRNTKFRGISWQYGGRRTKFLNCDFTGAIFNRTKFLACRFNDCIMEGVDFDKSYFKGSKVDGKTMESASNK